MAQTFTSCMVRTSLILAALLFMWSPAQTFASHVGGGNIEYECIGNDSFRLKTIFFRDCSGIPAPPSISLVSSNTGGCTAPIFQLLLDSSALAINTCSQSANQTTCGIGNLSGREVYYYSTVTALSSSCGIWDFSFAVSARNTTINAGGGNFHVESSLNNQAFPCNNSPTFLNNYVPLLCSGQPTIIDFNGVDIDGDSLVFSFETALIATSTPILYNPTYSALVPMTGIQINPTNGVITVTPTMPLGNYTLVVRIDEYEPGTGLLKGFATRDIQVIVQICNAQQDPYCTSSNPLSTLTGTATMVDTSIIGVCAGGNFCFDLVFEDVDSNNAFVDTLTISSNITALLPGATVTMSGTNPLTATVCATNIPATNNLAFSVTASDNGCPYIGTVTKAFVIQTGGSLTATGGTICSGNSVQLGVSGSNNVIWSVVSGDPITASNFSCTTCVDPIASPSITTTYLVSTNDPLCTPTTTVTVVVNSVSITNINTIDPTCLMPNSGEIQVAATSSSSSPLQYSNGGPFQTSPNFNGLAAGNYPVIVIDGLGCANSTQVTLTEVVTTLSAMISPDTTIFPGDSAIICINVTGANGSIQIDWSTGDTSNCITVSPNVTTIYTATVIDDCNQIDSLMTEVTVDTTDTTTSIWNVAAIEHPLFEVYPNPYQDQVNIKLQLTASAKVQIEVLDLLGKKVFEIENTNLAGGNHLYRFGAKESGLQSGIYFVRTTVDDQQQVKKIIEF